MTLPSGFHVPTRERDGTSRPLPGAGSGAPGPRRPRRLLVDLSLHDRSIAFLVLAFLFAAYLGTYTGEIQSSDGLAMFATAENMVRRGGLDVNQLLWMGQQQGTFGPDGNLYSRKGLGMSLLAFPLVWMARLLDPLGLVQMALFLNPLLTAWTGAFLYRTGIRLGWRRGAAVLTALTFGLATLAWPYTQTFFSDPVAAWALFGAFYGLLAYAQSGHKGYLFLAGCAWGLAYLARAVNLVTLPLYGAALAWLLEGSLRLGASPGGWLRRHLRRYWRPWFVFGLPVAAAGLVSLWWNWVRFRDPLESGYLDVEAFNGDWLFGIFGLLMSPGRGLMEYSPVLLLALVGVWWFGPRYRWIPALALGITLLHVLLYGKWYMWHGGYSWGPRFLVPTVPFLALLCGPVWDRLVGRRGLRLPHLGALALLALSVALQWLGLLVPFRLVQDRLAAEVQPLFAPETFVQWRYSPLVRQWEFLAPDAIHLAWWRVGRPDLLALALILLAVAAGAVLVVRQVAGGHPRHGLLNWAYGLALALLALVLVARYQAPLSGATNRALAARIQELERPGDGILHLRPLETQAFANVYHGRLPVYGLWPIPDLGPKEEEWLARMDRDHRRLWVIPGPGLPENSGWERALRFGTFLLLEETVAPQGQRLALYVFPDTRPLVEGGLGIRLGDPPWVRLNGYGLTEWVAPGQELLLVLKWESLAPVTEDFQVFVHLLDSQGNKIDQRDGQPVLWMRPTRTWQPGERIVDRYTFLLPQDLPPGTYWLAVGLYDPVSGEREPVSAGQGDNAIKLGPIQVGP